MKQQVVLSLQGTQNYADQEPDTIELVTEGVLEQTEAGWVVSYDESDLTGMEGVRTSFAMEEDRVVLTRTGKLNSQMVFRLGIPHDSLYQMEFGALMITVCATDMHWSLSRDGGTVELHYTIEIEQSAAGTVDYLLQIVPKSSAPAEA